MRVRMKRLFDKLKESLMSVIPITVIVLILAFTVAPLSGEMIWGFLIGALFVVIGLTLFSLGADTSMIPIGHSVGARITRTKTRPDYFNQFFNRRYDNRR